LDEGFRRALDELVRSVRENSVDAEGGWRCEIGVEIVRIEERG